MKGFYRRPSKAIEQGGGFFFPGLEGERIRIVTAFALLIALLVNQIGQSFTTFNEVVSEVVGVAVIIALFVQGISAGIVGDDVIEVNQTFLTILQSSNDEASKKAEIISKSIIQSCEDINYILVISNQNSDSRVILEYAPIGVPSITKAARFTELKDRLLLSNEKKSIPVDGEIASILPVYSINREDGRSSNKLSSMSDVNGNLWLVSNAATCDETNVNDVDILERYDWITKLVQAPILTGKKAMKCHSNDP